MCRQIRIKSKICQHELTGTDRSCYRACKSWVLYTEAENREGRAVGMNCPNLEPFDPEGEVFRVLIICPVCEDTHLTIKHLDDVWKEAQETARAKAQFSYIENLLCDYGVTQKRVWRRSYIEEWEPRHAKFIKQMMEHIQEDNEIEAGLRPERPLGLGSTHTERATEHENTREDSEGNSACETQTSHSLSEAEYTQEEGAQCNTQTETQTSQAPSVTEHGIQREHP
ncbi:hypothetical protein F4778DRAFT_734701 [Xylariomycetidae sp. FL2044]|nr:hypothetical protein F4778DRAFT_734701 [Xylariomycetidae sp. FL2044]